MDEVDRFRYRLSNLNDELHHEISRGDQELINKIESLREETVDYEEFAELQEQLAKLQSQVARLARIVKVLVEKNGLREEELVKET